ncbi:MAG: glycogen synthase [Pyrinomonadaceae bacterium]
MRIAILSSEGVPFAKAGGLGDVAGALPHALKDHRIEAVLILPLHRQINRQDIQERFSDSLEVEWQGQSFQVTVYKTTITGTETYFIDAPPFFDRPGIYGYEDDHERYAFFSHAGIALLKLLGKTAPAFDVLHCNDWPGGFAIALLSRIRQHDNFFARTKTLFSIHNIAYQGQFYSSALPSLGFPAASEANLFMSNGAASALKAGMMACDCISTVSRRYAHEIQTPEQGYGLDWLARRRNDRLVGITNGIDYAYWNPETDPHIAVHYSKENLTGKQDCKLNLLRRFGLAPDASRPVVASISRLVEQKGIDLIREAAGEILGTGTYFIALGSGENRYENFLQGLHDTAPQQVGIYKGYNEPLSHIIEAGADIFLMPSLYEPCGLNQMYSMRYGTIPVVRATGGLDDTVEQFDPFDPCDPSSRTGTGFKFYDYSARAMMDSLRTALYYYTDRELWLGLERRAMQVDNSWSNAARQYADLYDNIMRLNNV